jgi:Flp pilus assembly secretin CpaC/tetratricopeptide (TPR) repeat protein
MQRCTLSRGVLSVFGCLLVAAGCTSSSSDETAPPPAVAAEGPTGAPGTGPQDPGIQDVADRQRQIDDKRRTASAELVKQGRALMQAQRFEEARKAFLDAYTMDVSNREAALELDRANAVLGRETVGATPAAREGLEGIQSRIQQAQTEARYEFNLGTKAHASGDYAAAVEHFQKALTILRVNPSIDSDFNETAVRSALATAKADLEAAGRETERRRLDDVNRIEREREAAERARVQRTVDENYRQAVELFKRGRYEEVQRLADEILRLDFGNEQAKTIKEGARRAAIDLARSENISKHREQWISWIEEVTEIRNPKVDPMGFPALEKWKSISAKGPIDLNPEAARPSEVDEEIRRRLAGTMLRSVDWTDKPLKEALAFIRNTTNVNVNIDRAVDEKVPEADRNISLTFENISAASALNLAVESLKLKYVVEGGLVRITTPEELGKRKVTNFYEVRDLTGKIQNWPGPELNLNVSNSSPGAGTPEEDTEENRTIEAERLIEMIRGTVDKASWDDGSGNTITDKNGTLVVSQTAENHRLIRDLLSNLRKTTGLQVAIESRFISVENNFLQDIGVDFRGLGDDSGGQGQPGRGTPAPFDDFGVPGTGALPIGTDNSAGLFYQNGTDLDLRGRAENIFNSSLGAPDTLTSTGGFSLQYAYIEDTQVEAILRAVQKYERVNTVTAPKLVVSNTQRAHLQVINHVSYIKDFDVEIAQAAVIADPIVDVVKEGVILDVRPTVSNDRRFVTLELRPTVATLVRPIRRFTTTLGVGTAVTFEVPELKKQSIKTTVVMPDGATLLLGGMKFYEEQTFVSGIPILKDLPILDLLFSRKGKYTSLKDLIVLLKVRILVASELEPNTTAAR